MTGATSGIGQVAAVRLAEAGARIVLVARDRARAALTLSVLRSKGLGAEHSAVFADLSLVSEMKRAAAEIVAQEPRVDVLINNAGALFWSRSVTGDGIERTFAINHVGYFVMALGLEPALRAAPRGAGRQHRFGRSSRQSGWTSPIYRASTVIRGFRCTDAPSSATSLFTREAGASLVRFRDHRQLPCTRGLSLPGLAIRAEWLGALAVRLSKLFAISPERGAQTLVHTLRLRLRSPEPAANISSSATRRPPQPRRLR